MAKIKGARSRSSKSFVMPDGFLSHMSLAGYFTIVVLLGCSFVMVALSWEFLRRSKSSRLDGDWLLNQVRYLIAEENASPSLWREYLAQLHRPLSRICCELLALNTPTLEKADYFLAGQIDRERLKLERGLSHLGTIAVIAPFVGLLGTVVGITKTFADVAKQGKAGIEVVSAGVSEALVATAIGLLVAITSVVLFNHFKKRFEDMVTEWDITARHLLTVLVTEESQRAELFSAEQTRQPTTSVETFLENRQQAEEG